MINFNKSLLCFDNMPFNYCWCLLIYIKTICRKEGKPDVVHTLENDSPIKKERKESNSTKKAHNINTTFQTLHLHAFNYQYRLDSMLMTYFFLENYGCTRHKLCTSFIIT